MSEQSPTKSSDRTASGSLPIYNYEMPDLEGSAWTLRSEEANGSDRSPSLEGRLLTQESPVTENLFPPQVSDMETEQLLSEYARPTPAASKERYARIESIAPFLPNADPNNKKQKRSCRVRLSKRSTVLWFQTLVALVTCLCNIAFTVWAYNTYQPQQGVGKLPSTDYISAAQINTGAHVILNVLSSLFLGAGNYCMQILVAPSAESIRARHVDGKHLDIGVQSMSNLTFAPKAQRVLWMALGTISLLLHLLWNSAIFITIPFVHFPAALVTSNYLSVKDDWNTTRPEYFAKLGDEVSGIMLKLNYEGRSTFRKIPNTECMDKLVNPLSGIAAEVILVTTETVASNNGSSLIRGWITGGTAPRWESSPGWVCDAYNEEGWPYYCSAKWAHTFADNWKIKQEPFGLVHVQYCLVGKNVDLSSKSEVNYNADVLVLLCVLTSLDTLIIFYIAMRHRQHTIVQLGDAVAEALQRNTMPRRESGNDSTSSNDEASNAREVVWPGEEDRRLFWFSAVSRKQWIWSMSLMLIGLFVAVALLVATLMHLKGQRLPTDLLFIFSQGVGRPQSHSLVGGILAARGAVSRPWRFGHILFANSFQVLVSFLYLFYNNILTRQVAADEFLRFLDGDTDRKALRVSSPKNSEQRSSYFLSLPWKYAIPQMIAFMLLHWLVSQSIFIVLTSAWNISPEEAPVPNDNSTRLGFSCAGIFLVLIVATTLVLGLVTNSVRRYSCKVPGFFPRMATNSAAIYAVSRPAREDYEAYLFPVKLGVVAHGPEYSGDCKGRITFSSDTEIQAPRGGVLYEMPKF